MLDFLKQFLLKRKCKAHLDNLYNKCTMGQHFCESGLYENRMIQLLNVSVLNKTNDKAKVVFGDYCNVSCSITLNNKGSVKISDYVFMNYVKMRIDYNLVIGSHCLFGPNVTLWDTDNHPLSAAARRKQAEEIPGKFSLSKSYEASGGNIIIEENVWIGMDALVLGGVSIGKGSIVASRSVVTKDIPPYTIVGGIPAKIIGKVPL